MFTEYVEKWFDDIGFKIKRLAKIVFIIELVVGVIAGVAMILISMVGFLSSGDFCVFFSALLAAAFTLVLVPVSAWLSSFLIYALGEIVEKVTENERHTRDILNLMLSKEPKEEAEPEAVCAEETKPEAAPLREERVQRRTYTTNEDVSNEELCDVLKYTLSFVNDKSVKAKIAQLCENEKYADYFAHLKDVPENELREAIKATIKAWQQ